MNRDDLLDELTEDIFAYAMQGSFPRNELTRSIKPAQLDDRLEEYQLRLDLHFVLQPEATAFVEALPANLRRIRTTTLPHPSRNRRLTAGTSWFWKQTVGNSWSFGFS